MLTEFIVSGMLSVKQGVDREPRCNSEDQSSGVAGADTPPETEGGCDNEGEDAEGRSTA